MTQKEIKVNYVARVEGEASLDVKVKDGKVEELYLDVYEPPRFFQGFLVGRKYDEVADTVSRICGICPVSHQLTALQALEDAMGVTVSQQTRDLRKLLALAQWIQSHTLHVYMLAAPDFLGYESVLAMTGDHLPVVQRALRLKKLGNDLTDLIGGRAVHPITCVVGGFTKVPSREKLLALRERLAQAKEEMLATVDLVAGLPLPDFTRECEHVALSHPDQYAVNEGRLVSTRGLDITVGEYRRYIKEKQVPWSHALHSYILGRDSFMVGPLARVNLNFNKLSPDARRAAERTGIRFPNFNPFVSALARAIELVHCVDECVAIIDGLDPHDEEIRLEIRPGEGAAITEAPRGALYHSYKVNAQGIVEKADIVSPTAHNVNNIEKDLWEFVPRVADLPEEEATLKCEMAIRNYDPCFSCSAHFLRMKIRQDA